MSNSKQAKIDMTRADKPHAFSRQEHNLHFSEKILTNVHFQFSLMYIC